MTEDDAAYVALNILDDTENLKLYCKPNYSKPNKTKDLVVGLFFIGIFVFMLAALNQ